MQSSSRQPRKWTLAEDQLLREEVEAQSQYKQGRLQDPAVKTCITCRRLTCVYLVMGSGDVKDWYELLLMDYGIACIVGPQLTLPQVQDRCRPPGTKQQRLPKAMA